MPLWGWVRLIKGLVTASRSSNSTSMTNTCHMPLGTSLPANCAGPTRRKFATNAQSVLEHESMQSLLKNAFLRHSSPAPCSTPSLSSCLHNLPVFFLPIFDLSASAVGRARLTRVHWRVEQLESWGGLSSLFVFFFVLFLYFVLFLSLLCFISLTEEPRKKTPLS